MAVLAEPAEVTGAVVAAVGKKNQVVAMDAGLATAATRLPVREKISFDALKFIASFLVGQPSAAILTGQRQEFFNTDPFPVVGAVRMSS